MSFFYCRLKTTSNELSLEPSELNEFPAYIVETLPLPRLNVMFYAQTVLNEEGVMLHELEQNQQTRSVFARKKEKV